MTGGPMRGDWNPTLLARLQHVRRETARALDAVQVGDPIPAGWWEAVAAVRRPACGDRGPRGYVCDWPEGHGGSHRQSDEAYWRGVLRWPAPGVYRATGSTDRPFTDALGDLADTPITYRTDGESP